MRRFCVGVLVVAALSVGAEPALALAQPYPGGDGYAVVGFGAVVAGGVTASVGTQLELADGAPSRDWSTVSYVFSGLNAAFAVGWLIAGVATEDDGLFYALSIGQGCIAGAALVPAIITTAALPETDEGIVGQERPNAVMGMPFQISGRF